MSDAGFASEYIEEAPEISSDQAQNATVTFTFRSPNELLALKFDDSDNLMGDRVLCKGGRSVVLGQGGIGKSFLVLQMAVAHITGRDFVALKTHAKGLKWLVIQAENNNRRLQFDMQQLQKWCGAEDWLLVDQHLQIHTLEADHDFWIHVATDNQAFDRVCEAVKQFDPDVVVFDPLKDLTTGDLNKDVDMRQVCEAMSAIARVGGRTDRVLCVLHHSLTGTGGAERATGMERASFGRNSKILHSWGRSVINIVAVNEDNSILVVACGKNNNGREFPKFAMRRDSDTLIFHRFVEFDIESWEANRGKKASPARPSSEQVVALFKNNPNNPRSCLMTGVELCDAFKAKGWDKGSAASMRDKLEGTGELKVYHGRHNLKLAGLPGMVDLFVSQESSKGTILEQAALPTTSSASPEKPRRKKRKK